MRKIVHINASYKPAFVYGGPTISISTLCEKMQKGGEQIEVITTTANGDTDFLYANAEQVNVEGVTVHYFKRLTKDHSHFSPCLLLHLFKHLKNYSIIHIHAWWNLVSVGAALVCWIKGRKFVFSPRGQLNEYSFNTNTAAKRWFQKILGNRMLKNALFQVSSENEAKDIRNLFPNAPIRIISNFINLSTTYSDNDKRSCNPLKLLFFSRIEQKKGLDFLLKALPLLRFNYTLSIYGEGEKAYIESLQSILTDADKKKVFWNEGVYGVKKFEVFSKHDLVVLPSYAENFANVIVESLSVGTAVLVTKNVGLSDYVQRKDFGWIVDQSHSAIATTLDDINNQDGKLNRVRVEAPAVIAKDFGEENLMKQYLEFYNQIANRP